MSRVSVEPSQKNVSDLKEPHWWVTDLSPHKFWLKKTKKKLFAVRVTISLIWSNGFFQAF